MSKSHADLEDDDPDSYKLTAEDRAWVAERLAARGWKRGTLAKRIGMTRQNIYKLLDGSQKRTLAWPAIVEALGGTPPGGVPQILRDPRLRELVTRWQEIPEADRVIIAMLAKRQSKP